MDAPLAPSNCVKWDKFVFKESVGTLGAVIWELSKGLISDVLLKVAWMCESIERLETDMKSDAGLEALERSCQWEGCWERLTSVLACGDTCYL